MAECKTGNSIASAVELSQSCICHGIYLIALGSINEQLAELCSLSQSVVDRDITDLITLEVEKLNVFKIFVDNFV